ncbi:MAG: hypothetical protein ABIR26_13755 [Ramlibacter sp.]
MREEVTGQVQGGYFVATYACELPESPGKFIGYYKACLEPPGSYWEAKCVFKGCTLAPVDSPDLAVHAAIRQALQDLKRVPAAKHVLSYKCRILSGRPNCNTSPGPGRQAASEGRPTERGSYPTRTPK